MDNLLTLSAIITAASLTLTTLYSPFTSASEIDSLRNRLDAQQLQISDLQEEIKEQQTLIDLTAESIDSTDYRASKTNLGGYFEAHYNNLNDQSAGNAHLTEYDLHRFVLFISHDFSSKTRFFSELEVEHGIAGEGQVGEVEIEQAYIEHDINDNHHLKLGVIILPIGILNETHEPNTFYGVERNAVEKNIIPATWWEGGAGYSGTFSPGWSYDATLTTGLYLDIANGEYKIRSGRQKAGKAKAEDLATTLRLKYTGITGLELGASVHSQSDLTQGDAAKAIDAVLLEMHAAYQSSEWGFRALYAQWSIDEALNAVQSGAAKQQGFYIEPSYRINDQWGIFLRASQWDNMADNSNDSAVAQLDIGFNYHLTNGTVLKFDIQDQNPQANNATELDGFNLGVGVSF